MTDAVDTSLSVEEKALEMGWSPKEKWRGDPEKWVDAADFVKRGEEILPILRHNNQQLLATQGQLKKELQDEKERREAIEKQLKELADFQAEEVARQVKERTKELRQKIREAREAGDTTREDELTDELEEVRTRPAPSPPPAATPAPPAGAPDPSFVAWSAANKDWWQVDIEKTSLAIGIATKIRGDSPLLQGEAFFREVDKRLAKFLQLPSPPSRVEGGGGGGGGSPSSGRSYADLPAEAKAVCDAEGKKFVGANKLFKDAKEWQVHYAKLYFSQTEPQR